MTEPENEKTLDIARRSRKNLEFIYLAKQQGADVEEFTQLLNSMLGMVISLREDYFAGSEITWDDVEKMNLPGWHSDLRITGNAASSTSPKLKMISTFSQLITRLRNAFAHNNFVLIVDRPTKQILGVTVWNIPPKQENHVSNRVWQADINETQLKGLAYLFVEYLEKELD